MEDFSLVFITLSVFRVEKIDLFINLTREFSMVLSI